MPATVSVNQRVAALGETLYNDTRLSVDGTVSCATCHDLARGGVDRLATSIGVKGQRGPINSPTVYNSAHNFVQFWDGRAATLEEQAAGPVENPLEMGDAWPNVIAEISSDLYYREAFDALFAGDMSMENATAAIAEFERTLTTPNARFDQYLQGDKDALTEQEKRGALLFAETGCMSCHTGDYFGGESFQALSVSYFTARGGELTDVDLGRFNVTGADADRHAFKAPMLRNVAVTSPYFHDASASTLEDAVSIMAEHQLSVSLADQDVDDIAAFLSALTGEYKGVPLDKMTSR